MSSSYLVNIVANDFKDGSGIFDPFQLGVEKTNGVNGVSDSVSSLVNGLKETAISTKDTILTTVNGLTNGQANGQVDGQVNGH